MAKLLPRYPIYIPSKGRPDRCLTAKFLCEDDVPFYLVVEEQERDQYARVYGDKPGVTILVLPFRDRGTVVPARNWIRDHSRDGGHARHWQLDDNIRHLKRWYRRKRIRCDAGIALSATEDFTDRYKNVAVSGLMYDMFAVYDMPPFMLNVHVYSCTLTHNDTGHDWRGEINEDTDYCLQVLADNWCTISMVAFLCVKMPTLVMKGGHTTQFYKGDGRLRMARSLERVWPGVVTTKRKFRRAQHSIRGSWRHFDTPLQFRDDYEQTDKANEYGMVLRKSPGREPKSVEVRKLLSEHGE